LQVLVPLVQPQGQPRSDLAQRVPRASQPAQFPAQDALPEWQGPQALRVWPLQAHAACGVRVGLRESQQAPLVVVRAVQPEEQPVPLASMGVVAVPQRARVVQALRVPACLATCAGLSPPHQSQSNSSAFSFRLRRSQATGR
jgi:hypothetical protein